MPQYVMFPEKECPLYASIEYLNFNIANDVQKKVYGGIFGFCIGDM